MLGEGYVIWYLVISMAVLLLAAVNIILSLKLRSIPKQVKEEMQTLVMDDASLRQIREEIQTLAMDDSIFRQLQQEIQELVTEDAFSRRTREELQTLTMDGMKDALLIYDKDGMCIYSNKEAGQLSWGVGGMTKAEFVQRMNIQEGEQELYLDNACYRKDFHELRNEQGEYIGCYYVFHNVTEEREGTYREYMLATRDSLTGLYNRATFMEKARELLNANPDVPYLMVCSDIKGFKAFNDAFSIQAGDEVLRDIASEIQKRDDDNLVYGRIGDDSFAICMPEDSFHEESYLERTSKVRHINGVDYPIINHLGIYQIDDREIPIYAMCDRAMLAISSIQKDYQQLVAYYDDHLREELLKEQELLQEVVDAFEQEQFLIYLQPQFSYKTGQIAGAEALVRWRHPQKGLVPPGIFIPLLEGNGLITRLDQYVWEQACCQLRKWKEEGKEGRSISVNISNKDFYYTDLYTVLTGLVEKYHILPSSLKLEITESAFAVDQDQQVEIIEKLQKYGFIIEMDDFGSGYSSLNILKNMPVNILKMDMAFMTSEDRYHRGSDILHSVVSMAGKLRLPVIAEGVEFQNQAKFLSEIGCDLMQGYFYAKPMPLSDFEELLQRYDFHDNLLNQKEAV